MWFTILEHHNLEGASDTFFLSLRFPIFKFGGVGNSYP